MERVSHNPRCKMLQDPPTLQDPSDCNCGAIPPLEGQSRQQHFAVSASLIKNVIDEELMEAQKRIFRRLGI